MKIKTLVTAIMVSVTIAGTGANAQNANENSKLELLNVYTDGEFPNGETDIRFTEDGRKYRIRLKGTTVDEMEIDGEKIPKSEFAKYDVLVKRVIKQIEEHRIEAEKHRKEAAIHREEAAKYRAEAEEHRKVAQKHREEAESHRRDADEHRKDVEKHRAEAERHREEAKKHREDAEKHRKEAEVHRKEAEEHRKLMEAMLNEIVEEKIVRSRDEIKEIVLSPEEFTVNGKKQSSELHQRFKKKYLKNNEKFSMRFQNGSTNVSVD